MRRTSVLLAFAALVLTAAVGFTYKLRVARARHAPVHPTPKVKPGYEAVATEWRYDKDDPQTNKPVVRVRAKSFEATHDPSTFELKQLALRLYAKDAAHYTYIKCDKALFDEGSGLLKSQGPVSIVMNVPQDKDAENKDEAAKLVRVQTSGVTYETKSGKASTDQLAHFVFPDGNGEAVGGDYDPNTKALHLHSQVSLNWVGKGPAQKTFHVETSDLVYKEAEQKVYLSPWSKMQRDCTTIQGLGSVVTLQDGVLHQIDTDHAFGTDERDDRHTSYSADKMTALFDENGDLVNIVGENNAKVLASQPAARTTLTSNRADLRFSISTSTGPDGKQQDSSDLHLVLADGKAVAESVPLPQPGTQLPETRILRSEHIELEMKPGGRDVQEIRTSTQAQLEFVPNRPDQSHRVVDASHLRVLYGPDSYVDTFMAWNAATRTDKPTHPKSTNEQATGPALTWSDQLIAKFTPSTNNVATIEQEGNFRYQEGARKAWAETASLNQIENRMTLTGNAHVLDDTGSATADKIVMNQANGDMDAVGNVVSTHQPDKNEKPGTSMLDATKAMQAKADLMRTRDNNTEVHYEGHAVMWQGANRIAAKVIDINRDEQSLKAAGNVTSDLVDNNSDSAPGTPPVFTNVYAPALNYRDDTRVADYAGGVKLVRAKMTIVSNELKAFLTPKSDDNKDASSLDHAFADGKVTIFDVLPNNRTREGTSEHAEYYTKEDKVVLNGGAPHVKDSYKGITEGQQLTYYNGDDHLTVEGAKKQLAFTQMKKK
jgi:lipopolysaccharide export system protein LptA